MDIKEIALNYLNAMQQRWIELESDIWQHPEMGLQETRSANLLADELEKAGFAVQRGAGHLPTAFVASWGEGEPIVGLLGEYDALPGLSQQISTVKQPLQDGAPGHGCGHNLLGVGSLAAALAAKEAMQQAKLKGTIRYYGCPAEETMIGKVFMAREGLFDDLDAALTWHPFYNNTVWWSSALAMNSFKVNYHGKAAHAAMAPHEGRSALDAVELMDTAVNFMREHILEKARVHYVITHGGEAPNVVPAYAQVWYYVRSPLRQEVDAIYARMLDIVKGAALMTGTTYDVDFITGSHETLPNDRLGELLMEKLREVGPPQFSQEEREFARRVQETFAPDAIDSVLNSYGLSREQVGDPLCEVIVEPYDKGRVMPASTDVAEVSQITPTAQISTCCQALGTAAHSWQNTACVGSSIGAKGMMVAARALALAVLDLQTKPEILQAARAEFTQKTGGKKYVSPLPEGTRPH